MLQTTSLLEPHSILPGTRTQTVAAINAAGLQLDTENNHFGIVLFIKSMTPGEVMAKWTRDHPDGTPAPPRVLTFLTLAHPGEKPVRLDGASQLQATVHAQNIAEYNAAKAAYDLQAKVLSKAKGDITNALPKSLQTTLLSSVESSLQAQGLVNALTMDQLYAAVLLATKGTAASELNRESMFSPSHNSGEDPEAAIASMAQAIVDFNESTLITAKNVADQVKAVVNVFGRDLVLRTAMTSFIERTPLGEGRTFKAITEIVQAAYAATLVVGKHTTGQLGYANAALAPPQPPARGAGGQQPRPPPGTLRPYCYTHGNCGHTSADCRNPTAGHQISATAANKMGGSTNGSPTY